MSGIPSPSESGSPRTQIGRQVELPRRDIRESNDAAIRAAVEPLNRGFVVVRQFGQAFRRVIGPHNGNSDQTVIQPQRVPDVVQQHGEQVDLSLRRRQGPGLVKIEMNLALVQRAGKKGVSQIAAGTVESEGVAVLALLKRDRDVRLVIVNLLENQCRGDRPAGKRVSGGADLPVSG